MAAIQTLPAADTWNCLKVPDAPAESPSAKPPNAATPGLVNEASSPAIVRLLPASSYVRSIPSPAKRRLFKRSSTLSLVKYKFVEPSLK